MSGEYKEIFNVKGFLVKIESGGIVWRSQVNLYTYIYMNEKCLAPRSYFPFNLDKPCDEQINHILNYFENVLYTDEEIMSPCLTMSEYVKKKYFLVNIYINQVKNVPPNWGHFYDDRIYDPISDKFVSIEHKDFVEHHILLYKQLNKMLKPTIFPQPDSASTVVDKFMLYLTCLPYADEDDPMRSEAEEYISTHARDIAKQYYTAKCREITLKLVEGGYIKTPTMRKLLEMANDNDDSQLSAIIMEKLKDKQVSKSRFDI